MTRPSALFGGPHSREDEEAELVRARAVLEGFGVAVAGYRSATGNFSGTTVRLAWSRVRVNGAAEIERAGREYKDWIAGEVLAREIGGRVMGAFIRARKPAA